MEHLPIPTQPAYPQPKVPFFGLGYSDDKCVHMPPEGELKQLCHACCVTPDRQGWQGFPKRMGWDELKWIDGDFAPPFRGAPTFPSVVQAWLYDGVLFEFTSGHLHLESLQLVQTDENGESFITSADLEAGLQKWRNDASSWSAVQRFQWTARAQAMLSFLPGVQQLHFLPSSQYPLPLPEEVGLSFLILWETLEHCRAAMDPLGDARDFNEPCSFLYKRLMDHFWCPREIARLRTHGELWYASQLGPRLRQHRHDLCSIRACKMASIDRNTYKTRHTTSECTCEFLSFDAETTSQPWHENKLPLVAVDKDGNFKIEVRAIEGDRYFAVSHVWADGLGNPDNNAIPLCQARLIQKEFNLIQAQLEIDGDPLPWFLDTMCIPVSPSGDPRLRAARRRAIGLMGLVYSSAAGVLVRDAELMNSSAHVEPLELLYRVGLSPWSFRLWTYLEAFNATTLFFGFREGVIDIQVVLASMTFNTLEHIHDSMTEYLTTIAPYQLTRFAIEVTEETQTTSMRPLRVFFSCADSSLRNTSWVTDELICIAATAGFTVDEITALAIDSAHDLDAQVVQFLKSARKVDPIVAVNVAERLATPGFKWAPRRLLDLLSKHSADGGPENVLHNMHTVTDEGLVGHWSSVTFQMPQEPPSLEEGNGNPRIIFNCSAAPRLVAFLNALVLDEEDDEGSTEKGLAFFRAMAGKTCAFLYQNSAWFRPNLQDRIGILVEVLSKDGNMFSAQRIRHTTMWMSTDDPVPRTNDIGIDGEYDTGGSLVWRLV